MTLATLRWKNDVTKEAIKWLLRSGTPDPEGGEGQIRRKPLDQTDLAVVRIRDAVHFRPATAPIAFLA